MIARPGAQVASLVGSAVGGGVWWQVERHVRGTVGGLIASPVRHRVERGVRILLGSPAARPLSFGESDDR